MSATLEFDYRSNRRARHILQGLAACAALALVGLGALIWTIRSGLTETADEAASHFGRDRIGALIKQVECERCDLRSRNRAVWALGQMEVEESLGTLERYYTGLPCEHDRKLCQKELGKAAEMVRARSTRKGPLVEIVRRLRRPFGS